MLALVLLAIVGGCGEEAAPKADVVRDVAERGELKFTVEAEPREVAVGDAVTVRLSVETPTGYDVEFPGEDAFGELDARQTDAPGPRPGAVGLVWRRTFTLQTVASGPLEIPSLAVTYIRPPTASETQPAPAAELFTDVLKLEVRSALTAEDNPGQPRDITATLLPPKPPLPLWVWVLLVWGLVVVVTLVCVATYLIVQRAKRPPPPILPEVWALRALEALARADWFAEGRVQEHYYRLTEVVRKYIELKFGLAAPEMTTEEFLATLAHNQRALPYDAERLRAFLEACDFVKYAALRPRREDAEAVLATARAFVHATAAAAESARRATPAGGQAA